MAIGLSVTSTTATSATFGFTGIAADGTVELQIGPRPDFEFSIAPIYKVGLVTPYTAPGLNQRGTYFAQARMRRASQIIEGGWSDVVGFRTLDDLLPSFAPAAVMIEPPILVVPEKILALSPGQQVVGFPATNLIRDAPVAWRSQQSSNTFTLNVRTAGAPIDTIALLNTNVPEVATITLRAGPTEASLTSGWAYATAAAPFRASANLSQRNGYHSLVRLPALQAYPWWRIIISNANIPGSTSTLHAEHLVLGRNRAVGRNFTLDKKETASPLGSIERRRSGAPDRVEGLIMRKVDFDIENLPEAQYETILADLIYREQGPVLCVPNSKAGAFFHDRILYGDLTGGGVTNPYSPRFNRGFSISSLI